MSLLTFGVVLPNGASLRLPAFGRFPIVIAEPHAHLQGVVIMHS
jgi:hypothetical protein